MARMRKTVAKRLTDGLKRFQPVLSSARSRDVNESETSMIIADMLADVFGFDKYNEITRELCIRNTYCDLAIRLDEKVQIVIEVKAIDTTLKDSHVKQAVDYAANQGVEWVSLTNGIEWQVNDVDSSDNVSPSAWALGLTRGLAGYVRWMEPRSFGEPQVSPAARRPGITNCDLTPRSLLLPTAPFPVDIPTDVNGKGRFSVHGRIDDCESPRVTGENLQRPVGDVAPANWVRGSEEVDPHYTPAGVPETPAPAASHGGNR